ncbi:uncharacterized protein LOC107479910 [Arachis duranensis]|uniref:Uncharacterized protein LOC107479910 n=1 Tax=Arachis duranensis TaxID=130453 RepID=A0A9C6TD40_ARADU|nr:uncharacterized protein LOC107479910 [Arachis duranensis]
MTTAMDMVNKINPEKEAWNLKVRVIRLWTVPTFTGQLLPNSVEMILVDESGCKIQATVRKTMIYRFKQLLTEGRVYVMKLFSVVPNQGSYKATRHQFKLIFQFRTTVRDAICDFIPKSALTISPFTELLETKEDFDFLVVTGFGVPYLVNMLTNLIDFCLLGRVGLQNVMFASKLGFNLDIPEVAAFRKSSIPHGVSASQPIAFVGSGKNIGIEEDFMKLTPRCTVKSLDDNNRAGTFVVLAKIAEIVEDGPWWYSACVCGRGVQAESGIYFCQFCNIHVTNVTPRVKVLVEDFTSVSIFVLFDRETSYLLNKTCAQLFEQHLKDVDVVFGTQSPPIFQEIVGKTMLFKVLSRLVGMEKFKGTYPVRRVCDDAAILGMFELSGSDLSPEKCPLLKRKSTDAVVDKLNEVDSSENSSDEVDESEEEYVAGINRGSVDAEKDVKPSLKRLRRSLRLQFDEADESRGSGNNGSSGHGVGSDLLAIYFVLIDFLGAFCL